MCCLVANVEEDVRGGGFRGLPWERSAGLVRLFFFQSFRGFVPGRRVPFVSAKVAKTIDAPSGFLGEEGRELFEERPNSPGSDNARNG